jgi:hypothetical protein
MDSWNCPPFAPVPRVAPTGATWVELRALQHRRLPCSPTSQLPEWPPESVRPQAREGDDEAASASNSLPPLLPPTWDNPRSIVTSNSSATSASDANSYTSPVPRSPLHHRYLCVRLGHRPLAHHLIPFFLEIFDLWGQQRPVPSVVWQWRLLHGCSDTSGGCLCSCVDGSTGGAAIPRPRLPVMHSRNSNSGPAPSPSITVTLADSTNHAQLQWKWHAYNGDSGLPPISKHRGGGRICGNIDCAGWCCLRRRVRWWKPCWLGGQHTGGNTLGCHFSS